jgi:hypothetical protein
MNCPDTDNPVRLQNYVQTSVSDNKDQTYYFIVDTCRNLSWLTKVPKEDCATQAATLEKANDLLVQVKRMTRNF